MTAKPVMLVFPFDLLSHYLRCLQLADAIRDLYEVRFADSDRYRSFVEEAGFPTFPCETFDADDVMARAETFDFGWLSADNIGLVCSDQIRAITENGASIVLGDTAPTLKMAAEKAGVRYLSLKNGYMARTYAKTRPIASSHPAAVYADRLPESVFDMMTRMGERAAFRQIHRPFKKMRRTLGISRKRNYLEELEGDVNLICDEEDLFPQLDLTASDVVIGGLYHADSRPEPEVDAHVANERKTILATVGSSGRADGFSFLGSADLSCYNIVVAGPALSGVSGEHILTRPFLNMSAVLPRTDLLVCHGGNGSVMQALSFGVPVVCRTTHFEQEWNARRLEELGLGTWIKAGTSDEEIKRTVERWMERTERGTPGDMSRAISVSETRRRFREVAEGLL